MKDTAICPHCQAEFSISVENEGKRAKCKKCGKPFVITFGSAFDDIASELPPDFQFQPTPPPAPIVTQPARPNDPPEKSSFADKIRSMPSWVHLASASVMCLVLGYFVGRWHVKYQIRSAMAEAGEVMRQELTNAFGGRSEVGQSAPKALAELQLGQTFEGDGINLQLTEASISKPDLRDFSGDIGVAAENAMVFRIAVQNADDRKILRFSQNTFLSSKFSLRDDVDNVIRGVTYGANKIVGALRSGDEIDPGATVTHVEVFMIPPPKTESLVLTIDLEAFGKEGLVKFTIPANAIQGFSE
jgi:hypothetical protein